MFERRCKVGEPRPLNEEVFKKMNIKLLILTIFFGIGILRAEIPERVISMAPSITELIFELGAGDKIVGVTRFCKYPEEANNRQDVGGFLDPNYEVIVSLKPDLVIVLPSHSKVRKYLEQLNLSYLEVDHNRVKSVMKSIMKIGKTLGVEENAKKLKQKIKDNLMEVEEKTEKLDKPTVLLCLGRSRGRETFKETFAPGSGTIYNDMVILAGGKNIMADSKIPYPVISGEGILRLNPDVIIDLAPELKNQEKDEGAWAGLNQVSAIKNNRLHVFTEDFLTIPSIRLLTFMKTLAETLHPTVDWSSK